MIGCFSGQMHATGFNRQHVVIMPGDIPLLFNRRGQLSKQLLFQHKIILLYTLPALKYV